jgi:DtxR family transcriptional regulator, Mn-dependent transcriptional regulator
LTHAPSPAEQDYLKQIYLQQEESGRATTQLLAERLGVKPPSVTAMLKRLAEHPMGPYVEHTLYYGVTLTERGLAMALEIVRHHRLIELYLARALDVPWDKVHVEAERLEHALSEELEERIAARLGQPTLDPHGDPIPTREGVLEDVSGAPLASLKVGERSTVVRVPDGDPAFLQYLEAVGLVPGALVRLEAIAPYGDVLTIGVDGRHEPIGTAVARRVLVSPVETGALREVEGGSSVHRT